MEIQDALAVFALLISLGSPILTYLALRLTTKPELEKFYTQQQLASTNQNRQEWYKRQLESLKRILNALDKIEAQEMFARFPEFEEVRAFAKNAGKIVTFQEECKSLAELIWEDKYLFPHSLRMSDIIIGTRSLLYKDLEYWAKLKNSEDIQMRAELSHWRRGVYDEMDRVRALMLQ